MNIEEDIYNLIIRGTVSSSLKENEEDAAIDLLKKSADEEPEILWEAIFESLSYDSFGMALPALAAYLCNEKNKSNIKGKTRSYMIDLLSTLSPEELLEITEYIKSKVFGSGLGSFNQKLLANVIERWSVNKLKENIISNEPGVISLIRLLHPKLYGEKGDLVKSITNKIA